MKAVYCDHCGGRFAQEGDAPDVRVTEWAYIVTYAEMDHDVAPVNGSSKHLHQQCVSPWLADYAAETP